ncbi:hypothetical protein JOB18_025244, partial [Solea senegalensis]
MRLIIQGRPAESRCQELPQGFRPGFRIRGPTAIDRRSLTHIDNATLPGLQMGEREADLISTSDVLERQTSDLSLAVAFETSSWRQSFDNVDAKQSKAIKCFSIVSPSSVAAGQCDKCALLPPHRCAEFSALSYRVSPLGALLSHFAPLLCIPLYSARRRPDEPLLPRRSGLHIHLQPRAHGRQLRRPFLVGRWL